MYEFGPERGHFLYIFENFFKDFGLLIVALIVGIIHGDLMQTILDNMEVVIVVVILPAMKIVSYLTTKLHVTPEKLTLTSGWLKKKEVEIPAASITTIDYTQSLIQQIFKVYRIKIDNAGNMAIDNDDSVVKMVFSKEKADRIAEILGKKEIGTDGLNLSDTADINIGKKRKLLIPSKKIVQMGLLKSKMVLLIEGFGIVGVAAGFVGEDFKDSLADEFLAHSITYMAVGALVILIAVFIIGTIGTIIRFSNFTVTDDDEYIIIEYGLITRKKYTLAKTRISGFYYEQSLLMRMMKVGTLNVYAVGFGNDDEDSHENSVIHPLLSEDSVRSFMAEFTDVFDTPCEMKGVADNSMRYFFYRVSFYAALFILALSIFCAWLLDLWFLSLPGIVLIIIAAAGRIMEHANTYAGGNERELVLSTGGYKKTTTYIRMDNVESITTTGSIWKRRLGVLDMRVDFLGDALVSTEKVYNVEEETALRLRDYLIY